MSAGFENVLEQRTPIDLEIHGVIPPWLSGVLYRTGPGITRVPTTADPSKFTDIHHWFDGLALHHRFEIFPGGARVSYRSRSGADDLQRSIADDGQFPTFSFGQRGDPCQSIFRKFFIAFQAMRMPNATKVSPSGFNVSVTLSPDMPGLDKQTRDLPVPPIGPRYLVAKTDADTFQLLDSTTLEPLDLSTYAQIDRRLDGPLSAAHACRDPATGDFYNYSCKFGGRYPTYKIFRIAGADGRVDILAEIKDAPGSYIHSFAMTDRFVILTVWQAYIKYYGLSILYYKNISESIDKKWDPKADTLFYVVDRKNGGIVAKYKTPPFFCFHHINAFDDTATGDIIIDMSVYEDNSIIDLLHLDNLRNPNASKGIPVARARRFRLPSPLSRPTGRSANSIRDAIVEYTFPQQQSIELPCVAPASSNAPYRYAYGISLLDRSHNTLTDSIIKLDMSSSSSSPSSSKFWRKANHTPSEPIFVPRPDGTEEDDGVLLSVVLNEETMKSSLVVIDAKEMKEVGRAEMAAVFPIGFHGMFHSPKL